MRWSALVLLLALCVPAGARAQELPAEAAALPAPLELLLSGRTGLGLTRPQVRRMEALRERLRSENEPLVAEVLELRARLQRERQLARRGGAGADPELLARARAAAEPLHARIQANNRAAMQEVNRMLTPAQRARLRALLEARRGGGGGAGLLQGRARTAAPAPRTL